MKFIEFELLDKDGRPGQSYHVVPNKIVGVAVLMVGGTITDKEGHPVLVQKAGLDLGYKVLPVNMTQEEVVKKLEDWEWVES